MPDLARYRRFFHSGEWHLHTDFTDGFNTVAEYCEAAKLHKIPLLAFTEQVRRTPDYDFDEFVRQVETARAGFPDPTLLVGCEVRVLDPEGNLDVAPDVLSKCDVVLGAIHRFPYKEKSVYLRAVLNMLKSGKIDVWARPGLFARKNNLHLTSTEIGDLLEACEKYGVLIEANRRYRLPEERFLTEMRKRGLDLVNGGDIHRVEEMQNGLRHQNVWLPGAAGDAALCAIKALRQANFQGKIVTTDSSSNVPSFFFADKHVTLPRISEMGYWKAVKRLVDDEGINVVLPTSAPDILTISQRRDELQRLGIRPIVSGFEAVSACLDKWRLYSQFGDKLPIAWSLLRPEDVQAFPVMVMPRNRQAIDSSFFCTNAGELNDCYKRLRYEPVIQEFLPGQAFVVDTLSDMKGTALLAVPRRCCRSRAGCLDTGRVVLNESIQSLAKNAVEVLDIRGPCRIYLKLDTGNLPKITGIHPGLGSGNFSLFAGANISELILRIIDGCILPIPEINEVNVLRYQEALAMP